MENFIGFAISIAGLVYSVILLIVCSSIASDLVLSQKTKNWLITVAILVPVIGMFIAASKAVTIETTSGKGSNGGNSGVTSGDYDSSGGCSGGSE